MIKAFELLSFAVSAAAFGCAAFYFFRPKTPKYAKLLQSGRILLPQYSLDDEWFDIGTPERLYVASAYVREKQNNTAKQ